MHGVHLVLLAVVVYQAHPGRVGIHAAGAVPPHRVVGPTAFPQLVDQCHVLVGQVIAVIMRCLPAQANRPSRAVQVTGDDVPADAALGQVVQRGHAAGKLIGGFVGQVGGDAKTQVLRDSGHGRDQQHWVAHRYLHCTTYRGIGAAA